MTREDFLARLAARTGLRRRTEVDCMVATVDAALPLLKEMFVPLVGNGWDGNKVFEALDRLKARNGVHS